MEGAFSIFAVIGVAIISFAMGLIFKTTLVKKQRKRILNLEDEMLANHSRILALEKKIAETRGTNHNYDLPASATERKIS